MQTIFQGAISCKALLQGNRQCQTLYVDRNKRNKDFSYIIRLAKRKGVSVQFLEREQLNELAQNDKHGGMLLTASTREKETLNASIRGPIFYIDGLEDPFNLGSVCRSLYASGCQHLILPARDWTMAESTILKASAGAYEKMHIYFIESDQELLSFLKENKIPLLCANRKDAMDLYDYTFPQTFCMAIGGSYRGLRAAIQKESNQNLVVPYGNEFRNALDTASAAAVIGFEILRQQRSTL